MSFTQSPITQTTTGVTNKVSSQNYLEETIRQIENTLHGVVENDDDQALFIASYLHGHFDLVVSQVLATAEPTALALDEKMRSSLQMAFDNNELVTRDQQQVLDLWSQLMAKRQ